MLSLIEEFELSQNPDLIKTFIAEFEQYLKLDPAYLVEKFVKVVIIDCYYEKNLSNISMWFEKLYKFTKPLTHVDIKSICSLLLNNNQINLFYKELWSNALDFIYQNLKRIDYKGIRDLISPLIQKFSLFDNEYLDKELYECLTKLTKLIRFLICDASTNYIPDYLVVNELQKLLNSNQQNISSDNSSIVIDNIVTPHWTLNNQFADYINSFIPLSTLVFIMGRDKMWPVIGISNPNNVLWRLESSTLKFPIRGFLPYEKKYLVPQREIIRNIIFQPYSRDLLCHILGLKKQQKIRCQILEDVLAHILFDLLVPGQTNNSSSFSPSTMIVDLNKLNVWQHLASQIIFLILFHFCSLYGILDALIRLIKAHIKDQVEENITVIRRGDHFLHTMQESIIAIQCFGQTRHNLAWLLLQIVSANLQNVQSSSLDYTHIITLFDILFPERAMYANAKYHPQHNTKITLDIPLKVPDQISLSYWSGGLQHTGDTKLAEDISTTLSRPNTPTMQMNDCVIQFSGLSLWMNVSKKLKSISTTTNMNVEKITPTKLNEINDSQTTLDANIMKWPMPFAFTTQYAFITDLESKFANQLTLFNTSTAPEKGLGDGNQILTVTLPGNDKTYLLTVNSLYIDVSSKPYVASIPNTANKSIESNEQLTFNPVYPILCNAYSFSAERFHLLISAIMEYLVRGSNPTPYALKQTNTSLGASTGNLEPLSMDFLDVLNVHTKMSLIHNIAGTIIKISSQNRLNRITSALLETYARLLAYMETESLGIKGFINHLLPTVAKCQSWSILYSLLELLAFRLPYISTHYKIQILTYIQGLAMNLSKLLLSNETDSDEILSSTFQTQQQHSNSLSQNASNQPNNNINCTVNDSITISQYLMLLNVIDNISLNYIASLSNVDLQPQITRYLVADCKSLVQAHSEEHNKVWIYTLAKNIAINGGFDSASGLWCHEIIQNAQLKTPHTFPMHTYINMPNQLAQMYHGIKIGNESKAANSYNNIVNKNGKQIKSLNLWINDEFKNIKKFLTSTQALTHYLSTYKSQVESFNMVNSTANLQSENNPNKSTNNTSGIMHTFIEEMPVDMRRTPRALLLCLCWKVGVQRRIHQALNGNGGSASPQIADYDGQTVKMLLYETKYYKEKLKLSLQRNENNQDTSSNTKIVDDKEISLHLSPYMLYYAEITEAYRIFMDYVITEFCQCTATTSNSTNQETNGSNTNTGNNSNSGNVGMGIMSNSNAYLVSKYLEALNEMIWVKGLLPLDRLLLILICKAHTINKTGAINPSNTTNLINENASEPTTNVLNDKNINGIDSSDTIMMEKSSAQSLDFNSYNAHAIQDIPSQMSLFICQLLLLKPPDFLNQRYTDFLTLYPSKHFNLLNWHIKHNNFITKYSEKCFESNTNTNQSVLPQMFGNIYFRLLPIIDILIHRYLELPGMYKSLGTLLDRMGSLYRYHSKPLHFIYETLTYYYDKRLHNPNNGAQAEQLCMAIKARLTKNIIQALMETNEGLNNPSNDWFLTPEFYANLQQHIKFAQQQSKDPSLQSTSFKPFPLTHEYFDLLFVRIVKAIIQHKYPTNKTTYGNITNNNWDWRYDEFSNDIAHYTYVISIELLAQPYHGPIISQKLMEWFTKLLRERGKKTNKPISFSHNENILDNNLKSLNDKNDSCILMQCTQEDLFMGVSLILVHLPECFRTAFYSCLVQEFQQIGQLNKIHEQVYNISKRANTTNIDENLPEGVLSVFQPVSSASNKSYPKHLQVMENTNMESSHNFDFNQSLLHFSHTLFMHSNLSQLTYLPKFVREQLKPIIVCEKQFLYLCHLVGPYLQRFHLEKTRCLLELTIEIYDMLNRIDHILASKNKSILVKDDVIKTLPDESPMEIDNLPISTIKPGKSCFEFSDLICGILYHIKYMYTGDGIKNDIEKYIGNLNDLSLRNKLVFIYSSTKYEQSKSN